MPQALLPLTARIVQRIVSCLTLTFCLYGTSAAQSTPPSHTSVEEEFRIIHQQLDQQRRDSLLDESGLRTQVMQALLRRFADERPTQMSQALNAAVSVANRIDEREELLDQISALAYELNLKPVKDTSNVSLLFALGIMEHARGDMRAARMWFDSTIALHHRGLQHHTIASAFKLRGYVNRQENHREAAVKDFQTAYELYQQFETNMSTKLDVMSVLAAATVDAGGDPAEAVLKSTEAYEAIRYDTALQRKWVYAYLVYVHHTHVLESLGRFDEAIRVATEGLALCQNRGDVQAMAYTYLQLAKVAESSGEYAEARVAALKALDLFEATQHLSHLAETHECLERLYEQDKATLDKSLYHARASRSLHRKILEESRIESMMALQSDHRRIQAERQAAEHLASANFERERADFERGVLVIGIVGIFYLLAFVMHRLRVRDIDNTSLETEVAQRTAELAEQTEALAAKTKELTAKTRRLEASNQELERFAYIASHDLKTPLRNVTSFLGLIERRMPPAAQPAIGEYVVMAQDYAKSMHALVTNVLEFSRLNTDLADLCSMVDLRRLCQELADQRQASAPDAALSIQVMGSAQLVAPKLFLQQLFGNLIDNGLKYNESVTPRISIELHQTDEEVSVAVKDNGIGIEEEYHQRIFGLFKRLHTSDAYAGTGLGLASCRKIVERLGGSINVNSSLGEGGVFTIKLPKRSMAEYEGGLNREKAEELVNLQ